MGNTAASSGMDALVVLVVEDQQTVADALAVAFRAQQGIGRVVTATTAADATRLAALERPDVVILDLGLPDEPGLVLGRRLLRDIPDVRVVVLTGEPRAEDVAEAAMLGLNAFLTKGVALETLLAAVRDSTGRTFAVDPTLLMDLSRGAMPPRNDHRLTQRECEILTMMSQGIDARGIARALNVSPHTARDYIKAIYRKLDVHSQLEAILTAFRSGVLDLGA